LLGVFEMFKVQSPNILNIIALFKAVGAKVPSFLLHFCGVPRNTAAPLVKETHPPLLALVDV